MEEAHGATLEHTTWFHFLYDLGMPEAIPEMVFVTWFVIIVLSAIAILAGRNLRLRNPSKLQVALEFIVTALDGFVRNIVGSEARTLTPIVGTFFLFIFGMNLVGLIPGMIAPTANPNTTVSLALVAFFTVQYYGITRVGVIGYLKHFAGEPLWLAPLMFPLEVIGELARPLSLSIRLFGNIFGEETVVAVFVLIVTQILAVGASHVPLPIPLQFPMMLFAVFGSFIQALVFSMLTSIYIAVAIQGHEESH